MCRDFAEKELLPVAAFLDQNSVYEDDIFKIDRDNKNKFKFSTETNRKIRATWYNGIKCR